MPVLLYAYRHPCPVLCSCRLSPDILWPAARIRRDLFERITIQDVGFFDQQKTGELMNRLASDTTGRPITMDR